MSHFDSPIATVYSGLGAIAIVPAMVAFSNTVQVSIAAVLLVLLMIAAIIILVLMTIGRIDGDLAAMDLVDDGSRRRARIACAMSPGGRTGSEKRLDADLRDACRHGWTLELTRDMLQYTDMIPE